jgi:hypothetical protein
LRGSCNVGIYFFKWSPTNALCGWADADYSGSLVSKKSTSGYVITLFSNPISWTTKKQSVIAQSTTKAEFIATKQMRKTAQVDV